MANVSYTDLRQNLARYLMRSQAAIWGVKVLFTEAADRVLARVTMVAHASSAAWTNRQWATIFGWDMRKLFSGVSIS